MRLVDYPRYRRVNLTMGYRKSLITLKTKKDLVFWQDSGQTTLVTRNRHPWGKCSSAAIWHAGLGLLDEPDYLFFGDSALLHIRHSPD